MSEPIEAYPEAAAILRDAGWLPHHRWGVYTRGTLVMGFDHNGGFHIKDWSRIRPGDSEYGPDTPDEAHEAAAWLVAKFPARVQTPGHEGDGETGEEGPDQSGEDELSGDLLTSVPEGGAGVADGADAGGEGGGWLVGAGVAGEEWADEAGGAGSGGSEPDSLALDLGAEVLEEHADEFAGPQFVFGDNLDQMRTAAIGLVVRISRSKQAEIAALMGGHDFAAIQGAVMRDTQDGQYKGPQATYDLFVELSRHQNAINRVKATEADKVAFLEHASREEVEAFDPEQGWPK